MRKIVIIACCLSILGALLACEPRPEAPIIESDEGRVEAELVEAGEHEVEKYAPRAYAAATDALEKGAVGEAYRENAGSAERLAGRALDEAIRVREEAKLAADQQIRAARILFSVVEAVLSHHPPDRYTLPSDRELADLRTELSRAQDAYEAGDFAEAGHIAQAVTSALAGSAT
jgi:hypothetical protein